jgi:hypothetical protein
VLESRRRLAGGGDLDSFRPFLAPLGEVGCRRRSSSLSDESLSEEVVSLDELESDEAAAGRAAMRCCWAAIWAGTLLRCSRIASVSAPIWIEVQ